MAKKWKVFYEVPLKEGVFDIMIDVEADSKFNARVKALAAVKEICKSNRLEKEATYISIKEQTEMEVQHG